MVAGSCDLQIYSALIVVPRKFTGFYKYLRDYSPCQVNNVFGVSVCASVRPSVSIFITLTKPICSKNWVSGMCHVGSVFSYPTPSQKCDWSFNDMEIRLRDIFFFHCS